MTVFWLLGCWGSSSANVVHPTPERDESHFSHLRPPIFHPSNQKKGVKKEKKIMQKYSAHNKLNKKIT